MHLFFKSYKNRYIRYVFKNILSILVYCLLLCQASSVKGQSVISELLKDRKQDLVEANYTSYLEKSNEIAKEYYYNYNSDSSIIVLAKALEFKFRNLVSDSLLAACHHQLGICYYDIQKYDLAIEQWQTAIDLRKKFLSPTSLDLIKGYRNIANAYLETRRLSRAEFFLRRALNLNYTREEIVKEKEAQLNAELGSLYTQSEDLDKAERHLAIAEDLYLEHFQEDQYELAIINNNIYQLSKLKANYPMMIEYAEKSLEIYSDNDITENDLVTLASCYNNLAIAYDLSGFIEQSIVAYEKTLELGQSDLTDEALMRVYALASSNVTTAYSAISKYSDAIKSSNKAIELSKILGDNSIELGAYENLADVYLDKGDLDSALIVITRATDLRESIKSTQTDPNISLSLSVLVNSSKIRILMSRFKKNGKISELKSASLVVEENIRLLDRIRQGVQSKESKSFLSSNAKETIEQGIKVYYELYLSENNPDFILKAWELSEKSKSIILLESLRLLDAKNATQIENAVLIEEESIKKKLTLLEAQIVNNPDDKVALNKEYLQLSSRLESINAAINAEDSEYSKSIENVSDISLELLLKATSKDVIEYFIGDSQSFVFVKSNNQLAFYAIDSLRMTKSLVEQVRQSTIDLFRYNINKDSSYTAAVNLYNEAAYKLYELLFDEIQEELSLDLLLIPDGVLGYLPFDLLLIENTEGTNFSTKPYLIHTYNISYTYSLALLDEMEQRNIKPTKSFLAIAPSFDSNDEVYNYGNREVKKEVQPPLYFNEEEVKSISNILEGDLVLGKEATEEKFLSIASDYKILHLSTHGKANDERGTFSYLAFTEIVDGVENEFVYNYDLYNLSLNADMVVLSACETGLGELKKGEGIISLARGFSTAGAKSIINTLWTINDYRTKEIMESFYNNIANSESKDKALRKAKLEFITNNPDEALPFYWAAFIPLGDMSPIVNNNMTLIYFGILTLIIFSLIFFLRKKGWSQS